MERLSPEVIAVVRTQFASADRPLVLELLQRYGHAPHEREHDRVYLALLELSQGDVGKLREALNVAKVDYRDVLVWAEDRRNPVSPARRWLRQAIVWLSRKSRGGP
jgi:hypothetical protein